MQGDYTRNKKSLVNSWYDKAPASANPCPLFIANKLRLGKLKWGAATLNYAPSSCKSRHGSHDNWRHVPSDDRRESPPLSKIKRLK